MVADTVLKALTTRVGHLRPPDRQDDDVGLRRLGGRARRCLVAELTHQILRRIWAPTVAEYDLMARLDGGAGDRLGNLARADGAHGKVGV